MSSNIDSPEKNGTAYSQVPVSENDMSETRYDDKQIESKNLVDSSESEEASSGDAEVVIPPDGGWGWVVVLGSFMCNVIVDGVIFSFGTFLEDIAEEFNVTQPEVALVGSLMSGFYLIAGPFVSAIANRYGFRLVTIVGAIIAAAAFAISNFASSVLFLHISYGVVGGIGFGFIYAPSIITIGFYFEKWRALATGIAVCGSGIGTFVFAPISKLMIQHLGWRGALLCEAALSLSCIIYGCTFRPLKPTKVRELRDKEEEPELKMDPSKLPLMTKMKMEEAMRAMKRHSVGHIHDNHSSIPRLLGVNNNSDYPTVSDVYHTISIPNQKDTSRKKVLGEALSFPSLGWDRRKSLKNSELMDREKLKPIISPKKLDTDKSDKEDVVRPLYRDDIFFGGSLSRLPQYTSNTSLGYNLAITRLPTENDVQEERRHTCKLCPEALRRVLATMLDFSLLKSPTFLILAIGGFFTMMGFFVPYMYLGSRATSNGIDESMAVWLISTIGIANTFGRMFYGVISSFPGMNALVINNIALTVGGLATILSGVTMAVEYQFFYCIVFGLAISCFASLRSVVVVDLLGLEKLTNAFGLLLLFQGVAAIIGAPLAGVFMKATGNHDSCFYLSGGMILFSAVLCYPLNWINRCERRRNADKATKPVPV
ncbi:monocarboxylate transporter 12 [Leptinotarsa decemlineata]|uniref:monocarboxylate transporter 12 n=1 Tax=Leptinotarsa decemlineata TaxID=7539 RepID=UPI003D30D1C9